MKKFSMLSLAVFFGVVIGALFVGTQIRITLGGVQPVQRSPGDVNGDGSLNIADVSAIANFLFGIPPATPLAACAASPEELDRIAELENEVAAIKSEFEAGGRVSDLEAKTTLSDLSCADGEIATFVSGEWVCASGVTTRLIAAGFNPLGTSPDTDIEEYRHVQTGIEFVLLPGGTFDMGSPDTEPNRQTREGPVHEVTLSSFLIAKTQVTQAQYGAVMESNPSRFTGDDQRPVELVSWDALKAPDGFLARTGLKLPTEAQWEYAARGGTTTAFSFGDDCNADTCDFCATADLFMWWCGNSAGTTHPVGEKQPNPFGLHDMHGNVWEWCEDVYDPGFYSNPDSGGLDPVNTSGSDLRCLRGGSFDVSSVGDGRAHYCRSAIRGWGPQSQGYYYVGFRLAFWPLP